MNRDLAVALGYRPQHDHGPRVLASGGGYWAERIRKIAEHHGVPLQEDQDLAELLRHVPLAAEIPTELYPAVAQVFVFLLRLSREATNGDPIAKR